MNEQFLLMIKAALDDSGIKSDYNKIKQMFEKDPAKINTVMDMSATKTEIDKFIKEFAPQLQKMFKDMGVKIDLKDIKASMKDVFIESEKAAKQLYIAEEQAYAENKKRTEQQIALDKQKYIVEEQAYKTNENMRIAAEKKIQDELKNTSKANQEALNLNFGKVNLDSKITTFLRDNTKLSESFRNRLIEIQNQLKTADKTQLGNLKKEFQSITTQATALGETGKTVFGKFKEDFGAFTTFLSAGTLLMTGINTVRQLVSTVSELDKSLVDLQMATGNSASEAKKLLNTYIDLGKQLGATGTEVAASASEWLRQGKSISETNTLIKDSMILSKIGQIDSAQATEYLTSAMKGYKVEVSDVLNIVDKLSAVDLNSATSAAGLAEAMSRVANMASIAGVNMDKLLSYLATVGEVTQKDMSSIGESFQTMFSRMGNIKIGKMTDDNGESLNDVEKVLKNIGITLRDSKSSFRDFSDVLDDIGNRWNSLTQVEQNALGVAIAGTRQRENFTVLMSNYSKSLEYAEVSASSSGTAMEKFAAYEDSVEGKTKKLQASLQGLATDTLNSKFIKAFLDVTNVLVDFTDKTHLVTTAFEVFALVALTKIIPAFVGLGLQVKSYVLGLIALVAEQMAAAGSTGILTGAVTALNIAMDLNPIGMLIAGMTALVLLLKGAVGVFNNLNISLEENQQKLNELQGNYNSITSEVQQLESQLTSIQNKMKELEKNNPLSFVKDDEYKKLSESNDELQRRLTIQQELQKIAGKKVEEQAIATIETKSEISLTKVEDSYSNSGATRAALVTRNDAIQERIDAYNALKTELDELETKQLKLTEAGKTESKEYKNLTNDIQKVTDKRSEYRSYIIKTMDAINTESDSIVGATAKGDKYAKTINGLSVTVNDFINSTKDVGSLTNELDNVETASSNASNALTNIFKDNAKNIDDFQKSMKSIQSALTNTDNLSSSDIVDLMKQFSDFDWKTYGVNGAAGIGDLQGALKELARRQYEALDPSLKTEEAFKSIYEEAIQSSKGIIEFSESLSKQKQTSKDFYDDVLKNLNESIKKQAEKYKIDFDNYKNVLQAKLALDKEYALKQQNLLNAEMNFRNVMYGGDSGQVKAYAEKWNEAQKAFDDYIKFTTDFNTSLDDTANKYGKKDKKEFSKVFDWLSIRIENLKDKAQKAVDSITNYLSYKTKNSKIDIAVKAKVDEKASLNSIKNSYNKMANNVGLSQKYRDLVDNGSLNIGTITDEKLTNKIDEYKKWRDAAKAVGKEIKGIDDEIKKLQSEKLDNIKSYFENKNSFINSEISSQESNISLKKAKGQTVKESDYNTLIKFQNDLLKNTKKELDAYSSIFNQQVKDGIIKSGNKEYLEGLSYINDLTKATKEAKSAVYDYKAEIREIRWKAFDDGITKINNVKSELSDLAGMIRDSNVFDDNGNYTQKGYTKLGLFAEQIAENNKLISEYNKSIKSIGEELKNGVIDQKQYDEELANYQSLQRQAIKDNQSLEDSIADLAKQRIQFEIDAINKETDAFKDLIDAKKKSLQAEKDLHDYQKSINKKQSSIDTLNRQIATLSLSTDRKDIAQRLKLEQQLKDQQADLTDEQYKHSADAQSDALDTEYNDYKKSQDDKIAELEKSLKNQEKLVKDTLDDVFKNTTEISAGIQTLAEQHGITVTNSVVSPWVNAKTALEEYKAVLDTIPSSTNINTGVIDVSSINSSPIPTPMQASTTSSNSSSISSPSSKSSVTSSSTSSTTGLVSSISGLIRAGQTGDNVKKLQTALKDLGYNIGSTGVDGKFGDNTFAAVKSFQKDNGITQDGIVGDSTKAKFKFKGYKYGTNKILNDQLAWTQENGDEIIVSPSNNAILTPLKYGDGVINSDLTDNIIKWGKINPLNYINSINTSLPKFETKGNNPSVSISYGTLLNVEGNLDKSIDVQSMIDKAIDKNKANILTILRQLR